MKQRIWGYCKSGAKLLNSMCKIDWVMGCPDTWLNIILGVPARVFLDDFSI